MPHSRLTILAKSPLLLVGCDYDGTISELAPTPPQARANPRCMAALARLAQLPRTRVAVISGRPLSWLRDAMRSVPGALLFGSHGAEDGSTLAPLSPQLGSQSPLVALTRIASALDAVAAVWPGCLVERKPFGVALHYRNADPTAADRIIEAATRAITEQHGAEVRLGILVVEACISTRNKGDAVARARYLAGAANTVFFGDDDTDEDAFAALSDHDLSIKVGERETRAAASLGNIENVAQALESLADQRALWLAERATVPIASHSLLSDQRTVALLNPQARLVWLCLPRADSPPMFAEILGGPQAGFFSIAAADASPALSQEYIGDSLLLRTKFPTFSVTDYLDCSGGRAYQRAGRSDLVRVVEGRGVAHVVFAPRPDFGRGHAAFTIHENGVEVMSGDEPCVLHAPRLTWTLIPDGASQSAQAVIDLDALGGAVTLELRYGAANLRPSVVPEPQRRAQTQRHWSGWAGALRAAGEFRPSLVRSALTIKALCNGPSGAILAAATTSLPEQPGGVRNWDYRFCWPRDATMAATALMRLGNTGHAMKLTEWLIGIVDRLDSPERLRPIYTVLGADLGSEAEIGGLCGYADSRPVRVGNAAAQQVQLDVFGPITDMVAGMIERGAAVSPDAWRLVRAMVRAVEARWEEPDHGIWEIRGPRRHHVHSKVMCWHAVDRALVVHDAVLGSENTEWRALRDRIGADVLAKGWNEQARAFTGAYECPDLDAAALTIGLTGLLPRSDPRWAATVDAIDKHLREGATVYRYRGDDGLPGGEGGFVVCACWLVEAMLTLGRRDEARRLFDAILGQAGPTGLMAEQWDPGLGIALGNFPQAYSHLGLINAALALNEPRA